jgi:outer membrane lipoprotein-sorting protein
MRIISTIALAAMLAGSAYGACTQDSSGKINCNGQYSQKAQDWRNSNQQTNSFGATTTQSNRGGEIKTKNGRAVYTSPNGKKCYKTANNRGCL